MDFVIDVKHKSHFDIVFELIIDLAYNNPFLYAEEIHEKLSKNPDYVELTREMTFDELHKLDMMFFRQAGNYYMRDYNRPMQMSHVWIDGTRHYVTKTALFTFAAQPDSHLGDQSV